jgi:hypothetical protein
MTTAPVITGLRESAPSPLAATDFTATDSLPGTMPVYAHIPGSRRVCRNCRYGLEEGQTECPRCGLDLTAAPPEMNTPEMDARRLGAPQDESAPPQDESAATGSEVAPAPAATGVQSEPLVQSVVIKAGDQEVARVEVAGGTLGASASGEPGAHVTIEEEGAAETAMVSSAAAAGN